MTLVRRVGTVIVLETAYPCLILTGHEPPVLSASTRALDLEGSQAKPT